MSNEIKSIKRWFELAKPNPTIEDACVQIGCHYEEVGEMAEALGDEFLFDESERVGYQYKSKNSGYFTDLSEIKNCKTSQNELLDALCDQIVTSIGVAHMLGFDIVGALNEVNSSNYSKFENGKPVFNEQGKIAKGKDYFAPDLTRFIGGTNE